MIGKHTSFDWPAMIDGLIHAGMSAKDILAAMGYSYSHRILWHLRNGVQPLHFRGEKLVTLYCHRLGVERDDAPTAEVVRGYRAERRPPTMAVNLPDWPPVPQPAVKPAIRRRKAAQIEGA